MARWLINTTSTRGCYGKLEKLDENDITHRISKCSCCGVKPPKTAHTQMHSDKTEKEKETWLGKRKWWHGVAITPKTE